MAVLRRRLLVVALLLSVGEPSGSSSSPHSLRYFYTGLSQPGQGLPEFIAVGYVDDQVIDRYDSDTKRDVPVAPWMEKVGKDDPQYWERNTQISQNSESVFRVSLENMRNRYNQSHGGLHTWQWLAGCEVGADGQLSTGYWQYAYDGEDFITLDRETLTWTARVPPALVTKSKWEDPELQVAQHANAYHKDVCAPWLQRYLDYGQESLQRTEQPIGRVTRKKGYDDQETLFCQLYGFYPKEIDVTWMKDGVDQISETFTGGIAPNSDGTYHTWRSIKVDPKEKGHYWCRVGHNSLLEPLDLAWEEPALISNMGLIVGVIVVVVVLLAILVGAGVAFCIWRRRQPEGGYKATPGSDQGSDNSTKVAIPEA